MNCETTNTRDQIENCLANKDLPDVCNGVWDDSLSDYR